MSDVLSQGEVEALLAALDQAPAAESAAREAKSAASGVPVSAGSAGPFSADITLYDFKRPERVSKEGVAALTALHEAFARNVSSDPSAIR